MIIKKDPTLGDLQAYTKAICAKNGWDKGGHLETWLLLTEEIGELAKAMRNHDKLYQEAAKNKGNTRANLEEEFADVLSYIFHLANDFDIDLEKAFREKEAINAQRKWD